MSEPSIKQIRLVDYILRMNHFLEEPEFTAKAYWQFIHDNEVFWKRPHYEPDEDDLYWTCAHDVWCEEY